MRLTKLLLCGALALVSSLANATIVDGVRQRPTYETTGFVTGQEMYLYNVGAGQFFTQGNSWATQASIGSEGRKVRITSTGSGDYYLQCYCWRTDNDPGGSMDAAWRDVFFDSETALFVDRGNQVNYYFAVEDNSGTFRLSTSSRNPTFGDYAGAGLYVGLTKNGNTTALSPFVDEDEAYVDWAFVTEENYTALASAIEIYNKAQELKEWIDRIQAKNGDASSLETVYLNESASMSELQAAIDGAQPLYIQAIINNAPDKENIDLTMALVNPGFENGETGWTITATPGDGANGHQGNVRPGGSASNQCYEAWNNSAFDIYQTLTDMPVGVYEIEVQGFYRYGRGDVAWNAYLAQNVDYVKPEGVPVYVYLNNNATNFVNVFGDDKQITNASFYSGGSTDYSSQSNGNTTYYFPNGMASAAIAFSDGMYKQSAFGLIANAGDAFRIGVKGNSSQLNDSWVIWDNFKLYYRGFKAEVVQPILETAMADLNQYANLLMGKTEYANLSNALSAAQAAIENQDGEAMFQALNALYDVKESVIASKDLFLSQEVSTDLTSLQEAIAGVANEKLSAATRTAATTLESGIAGNTLYEGTQISQLKTDVSNAINNLNSSVNLYGQLNTAIGSLAAAAQLKVNQTLLGEANEALTSAQTGYDNATIADSEVSALVQSLNSKTTALNASATAYTNLNNAIGRLEAAIAEASEETARVAKSTLTKANLRLTASQDLYNNGTIADSDIAERISAIDALITELTHSIELYRQFNSGLASLAEALATKEKLSSATLSSAQAVYDTALEAYNEGTVDDDQIAAQITSLSTQVTAINSSISLYADLSDALTTLQPVVGLKAMQTLVDEVNELNGMQAGYNEGTIANDDIDGIISRIEAVIPQVQASAGKYADLATAITRLEAAIAEASEETARVAKSTLTKANLRLTASQNLYNNGTIADDDIAERVSAIDQLIDELTASIHLYQEFKTSLESLEAALATTDKLAAATRNAAQNVYDTALAAYNEGTVDDDKIEAQKNALNAQIESMNTSKSLYGQLNTAIGNLKTELDKNNKVAATVRTAADDDYAAAVAAYGAGTIVDANVAAEVNKLNGDVTSLQSSAAAYAQLATAIAALNTELNKNAKVYAPVRSAAETDYATANDAYDQATIADAEIPAEITKLNGDVTNLQNSAVAYSQLATAIAALNTELNKNAKVYAPVRSAAETDYAMANDAYDQATIADADIPAEVATLNAHVTSLQSSATAYEGLNTAITGFADAVAAADGKVADGLLTSANTLLSATQTAYDEGSIEDAAIEGKKTELFNATGNLNAADGLEAKAQSRTSELGDLDTALAEVSDLLVQAQNDMETCYIAIDKRNEIQPILNDYVTSLSQLNSDRDGINNRLTTDKQTQATAINDIGTAYGPALTGANNDLTAMEQEIADALSDLNDMKQYLTVEPAAAIAESSNIIDLTAEYGTFCSGLNLDFTDADVKAYIVSAYIPEEGKVILTRVYDVPAGTGLVVRGVEGGHYEIPAGNGSSVLSNLLVGTTRSKDLPVEEGDKTNCILADGSFGLGFYPTSGGILPAGKAYLPLPSSSLSQAGEVKGVTFVFEDATGIGIVESDGQDGIWYTVDGKMLQHKPFTPGVYVRNGKKVIVK